MACRRWMRKAVSRRSHSATGRTTSACPLTGSCSRFRRMWMLSLMTRAADLLSLNARLQPRTHRLAALTVLAAMLSGCATGGALGRGRSAEARQDYDLAVVEYSNALRERPDDLDA